MYENFYLFGKYILSMGLIIQLKLSLMGKRKQAAFQTFMPTSSPLSPVPIARIAHQSRETILVQFTQIQGMKYSIRWWTKPEINSCKQYFNIINWYLVKGIN